NRLSAIELKSSQADLLFSVRTINEQILFIYILLEHKSFIDRWVILQLLGYIVKICERQRDINKLNRQEIKNKTNWMENLKIQVLKQNI
ncbi:MAG: hypothetical protein OMM_09264, partial [Candidatus Magnetoglobus multicellularis str. Araruama]